MIKRDVGMCFWTFGPLPFEKKCQLANSLGVDGVEVEGDLGESPKVWQETLAKYNLKVLSVTPENVDIASPDEDTRKKAVAYFMTLLPWAKAIGAQRICLHGEVGKTTVSGDSQNDWELLVASTKEILTEAEKHHMPVVYEVLNRYENHQITTAREAVKLLAEVNHPLLSILLDAYHMNIEESNPTASLKLAGTQLGVYHLADSNREGMGKGHADLREQLAVLDDINYQGPIIMEMTATGPNPFTPVKEGNYLENIMSYYRETLEKLKTGIRNDE